MKKQKGFTLIELVMVIVILGILSAVAIPKYVDMQDEARMAAAKGVIGTVRSAIAIQYANNALQGNAVFPTLAELQETGSDSIFADGQMPDTPVPADGLTTLNSVKSSTADPIYDSATGTASADVDGTTAYVYNPTTGEIRFNNTDTDVNSKAWCAY